MRYHVSVALYACSSIYQNKGVLLVWERYCTYGSITPVPVIPTVGLMSTQPSRSAVKKGKCRFLDATIDPVLALIL